MIPPPPRGPYVSNLSATNFMAFDINGPSSESKTLLLKGSDILPNKMDKTQPGIQSLQNDTTINNDNGYYNFY